MRGDCELDQATFFAKNLHDLRLKPVFSRLNREGCLRIRRKDLPIPLVTITP